MTTPEKDLAFIIQARVGSTRLPKKILRPFYGERTILDLLIVKIKENFVGYPIILATSNNAQDNILEEIARKYGISFYRGDEANVLKRFATAAEHYDVKRVVRICADNPFLDVKELDRLVFYAEAHKEYDYISFMVNNSPSIKTHFGFWAEVVKAEALHDVLQSDVPAFYQEHVTNYIYEHPDSYKITFLEPNKLVLNRKDIRMTLDTESDFVLLQELYNNLVGKYPGGFGINETIQYLDTNPLYKDSMVKQISKNTK